MDEWECAVVDNLLRKSNVGTTVIRHLSLVTCSGKQIGGGQAKSHGTWNLEPETWNCRCAANGRETRPPHPPFRMNGTMILPYSPRKGILISSPGRETAAHFVSPVLRMAEEFRRPRQQQDDGP
jgi:hypothetical protein